MWCVCACVSVYIVMYVSVLCKKRVSASGSLRPEAKD